MRVYIDSDNGTRYLEVEAEYIQTEDSGAVYAWIGQAEVDRARKHFGETETVFEVEEGGHLYLIAERIDGGGEYEGEDVELDIIRPVSLTVTAAAAHVGRSTRTIRDWIRHPTNPLPAQQPTPGGPYLINMADLEAYRPTPAGAPGGPIRSGKYEYWRGNEASGRWTYYVLRRGDAQARELLDRYVRDAEQTTRAQTIADGIRDHFHLGLQSTLYSSIEAERLLSQGGATDSTKIEACAQDTRDWLDLQEQMLRDQGPVE